MAFNIKEILKFLFPEWQVIEAIKQGGFIARPNRRGTDGQVQNARQVTRVGHAAAPQNPIQMKLPKKKDIIDKAAASQYGNTASYKYKDTAGADSDNVSEAFDSIRAELGRLLVGQASYLDNLCIAFKRPFITGFDRAKPKNVVFVLGNRGTGKHTSIFHIARLMKQKKLISSSAVLSMDLSLYSTATEFGLFLSDLYKCLYGQADMVMFENFSKCHSSVLDAVTTLTLTGKLTLESRYLFQNNNLVEATGMLLQNSISEISSNGKYFIFVSEQPEQEAVNTFGTKFMDAVGDVVQTGAFSHEELIKIAERIIESLKGKCSENLSMALSCDNSVANMIAASYSSAEGASGMENYSDTYIYKPLAEYKLKNRTKANQSVSLSASGDKLTAQIGPKIIQLSELMPQKRSSLIEDVRRELENIIGIESVKQYVLSLEDNLKVQRLREAAGYKAADISMHMIFTGNPGTGKTTIARIVAKYLKALGVLTVGQLREVTRADLVGQYVGHTAKLTSDVIKSALGGVLFIDEAYSLCRDKHDTFGLEAIDALVKGIEDNRDDLVVILAGYKAEMEDFLKSNPGLKSRFPNIIEFEDYTPEEMYRISIATAKAKGYRIAEDCKDALIRLFEKKQVRGRNDSGNGRLARNVVESAILNQAKRLLIENVSEMDLLTYDDFKFEETGGFDLESALSQIISLDNVKEFIRTQYKLLIAQEKRRKAGIPVDTVQSLNMIFSGNPGTGKTTIARIAAGMFREMGLLKSGHLVETDRGGLVAEYAGQTAKKTEEVFRSALGGVLFIDEAYALSAEAGSFGKEAIDTLVKLIEDYRGEIVVILAGYKKEMQDFLKANSGLESRFPIKLDFPDYSAEELFEIALKMISAKGFVLAEGAEPLLKDRIALLHKQSGAHSGNARMVRNYLEELIRRQSARIAVLDLPVNEMNVIIPEDIETKSKPEADFDLEVELSRIIGLDEVKDYIRSLSARLRVQSERKKLGLAVDSTQTLHMIFKGNPGTGKTIVARTVARVLYNIGAITTDKLVETDRAGLVAGYVGQTAVKTRDKILEAMDGVLFIDEAYSLSQGGANDFGKEAIDTLVKLMDDYRDRIVVILAGYSNAMEHFLSVNPGLKSRFPNIIEFPDYTVEQLMQISELFFRSRGYELEPKAKDKLREIFAMARQQPDFGNGRYVRNVFERAVNNQALRLNRDTDLTKEELVTITAADIEEV